MAKPDPTTTAKARPRWIGDLGTFAVIFAVLGAVYLLPPDNSLSELKSAGRINVCMPTLYPPLVTDDPERPGFDRELLGLVGKEIGIPVNVVSNAAMANDFNPRSWNVSRAQCQMLAGGIALTRPVLSYLDATAPYLSTGWATVSKTPVDTLEGKTVGFFAGLTGLDRIALSRSLRAAGIRARIIRSVPDLVAAIEDGSIDVGISEALVARQVAGEHDWAVHWVDASAERYPIGIGLWKGDLTLKRTVTAALDALEANGSIEALKEKYDIADIEGEPEEIPAAAPSEIVDAPVEAPVESTTPAT